MGWTHSRVLKLFYLSHIRVEEENYNNGYGG